MTAGEAKDARASRGPPRLEERVCERGWRPTLDVVTGEDIPRRAHRRARPRAIAHAADAQRSHRHQCGKEAA
jgi:hypothetical protein